MKKENRWAMVFPLIIIWAAAILLFHGMCAIEPTLAVSPKLFSFGDWLARSQDGILYKVFWTLETGRTARVFGHCREALHWSFQGLSFILF